ncbi:K02A2.6-like [Cordylochernes scorpioides]|uniref:RNA-directed DNA polymerase n=1 Tax=Cordylochernes scorpioides TaxID=51811 RepID=A0ABY6K4S7_9ARAC|nr:K02A2.6-like [Cordylochernes scorpioides]
MENEQDQDAKNGGNVTRERKVGEASPLAEILLQLTATLTQVRSTQRAETDVTYATRRFFRAYDRKMDGATPDRLPGYLTRHPEEPPPTMPDPYANTQRKTNGWTAPYKLAQHASARAVQTTPPPLHAWRPTPGPAFRQPGVLKQVHPDGKTYPVQYFSRSLRSHERNYSSSELECLAIVESVDKFRVCLMDRKFTIFSDHHALQWLKTIKNPSGRLFRWRLRLSRYEYEVRYIKGAQQYEADLLSRNPFCGFLDAFLIKNHQPFPSGNSSLTIDHNGLHTVSRKGVTKIIIPKTLTNKLLQSVHTQYNHPGISQKTRLISTQYYWQGMSKDITQKVKTCPTCQLTNRPLGPTYGELGQPPEAKGPFDLLSLDIIAGNNPQANGLCERLTATLTGKLRLLHLENPKIAWTKLVKRITSIYNNTPHSVTGFPPIYLMFGVLPPELSDHTTPYPDIDKLGRSRTRELKTSTYETKTFMTNDTNNHTSRSATCLPICTTGILEEYKERCRKCRAGDVKGIGTEHDITYVRYFPRRRLRHQWCDERRMWMAELNGIVFTDESRFCLQLHGGQIRVWRHRGERMLNNCVMHRQTGPAPRIMVWGGIGYHSCTPLVRIAGTLNSQCYISEVLEPVFIPYLQGLPTAIFQQENA